MRATLWPGQYETSELRYKMLQDIFEAADIPLDAVPTREELLAAATRSQRASDRDFLIIDCAMGLPSDIGRCVEVAARTTLAVHIIHPREEAVREIEQAVREIKENETMPLVWLPAAFSPDILLGKLEGLKAVAAAKRGREGQERAALTKGERPILELVAAGRTNKEIAGRIGITESTAKTHVRNIMRKLDVRSRKDLKRFGER
jgi:DNA-binding NarL/FixJ family response regulator